MEQYIYYKDSKILTGTQTIDSIMAIGKWLQIEAWYYFYADGTLAVSTTIDEYEVDEKGTRKSK